MTELSLSRIQEISTNTFIKRGRSVLCQKDRVLTKESRIGSKILLVLWSSTTILFLNSYTLFCSGFKGFNPDLTDL